MAYFREIPYTTLSQLNLDWLIKGLQELETDINNFVALNTIKYANPFDWNITSQYAMNTLVFNPADYTAYLSVKPVPSGVKIDNTDYWTPVFTLADVLTAYRDAITPVFEQAGSPATTTIEKGQLFWIGSEIYCATVKINKGETVSVGTNCKLTNISAELVKLNIICANLGSQIASESANLSAQIAEESEERKKQTGPLIPYIINPPESGDDYKAVFEEILSKQDTLVVPPGNYNLSGLTVPDGKSISAFNSTFNITAPIIIGGRSKIDGAVIDCAGIVDNAIIIDGNNAPGATIENCHIYNSRKSAIVIGDLTNKSGGHQWIINTRIYNKDTLATCAEIYTPDVKIVNCEFYYTRKAINLYSANIFIDTCHFWSGGKFANTEENDCGIYCNDFVRMSLNNVYFDSFQHAIFNTAANTQINGSELFFYWDIERTFVNKNVNCLTILSGSRFDITSQISKSADVDIMAVNYTDVNNYSLNSPEKMYKRFKMNNDAILNTYDPYFDIGTKDTNSVAINPCKKAVESAWYIFGWIIPSTDSWVNLHIEDGNPAYYCDMSFYIDRNRTSLTTTASTNKFINADFAIGEKQIISTHSEAITAYPLLYKRTTAGTIPYEITVSTKNNQLFAPVFYMVKYENQNINIIGQIAHS